MSFEAIDQEVHYIPVPLSLLRKMHQAHEMANADHAGFKILKALADEAESNGVQQLIMNTGEPHVLLNVALVADLIDEYDNTSVSYQGFNYIAKILEQYEPNNMMALPLEASEEIKSAFLEGKVLLAYVGSHNDALKPFIESYNLVINTCKKALS